MQTVVVVEYIFLGDEGRIRCFIPLLQKAGHPVFLLPAFSVTNDNHQLFFDSGQVPNAIVASTGIVILEAKHIMFTTK